MESRTRYSEQRNADSNTTNQPLPASATVSESRQQDHSDPEYVVELPDWVDDYLLDVDADELRKDNEQILDGNEMENGAGNGNDHNPNQSETSEDKSGLPSQDEATGLHFDMPGARKEEIGPPPSQFQNEEEECDEPETNEEHEDDNNRRSTITENVDSSEEEVSDDEGVSVVDGMRTGQSRDQTDEPNDRNQESVDGSNNEDHDQCRSKKAAEDAPETPKIPANPNADIERNDIARKQNKLSPEAFMRTNIDVLYFMGLSPYNSDGRNPRGKLHWALYTLLTTIAVIQIMMNIKNGLAFGDKKRHIALYYVSLGYNFNTLLLRLCFAFQLIFRFQKICEVMQAIGTLEGTLNKKMVALLVGLPLILSLLMSLVIPAISSLENLPVEDRDVENVVLHKSYWLSKGLFVWSRKNFANESLDLYDKYGYSLSPTTVAMGLSGYLIHTGSYLEENVVRDVCLVLAGTLCTLCSAIENLLKNRGTATPMDKCDMVWTHFKNVRKELKLLNALFRTFFYLMTADNILYCSYYLFEHVIFGLHYKQAAVKAIVLMKIFAYYYLALRASSINEVVVERMEESFDPVPDNVEKIIQNIKDKPIGIGSGAVFIDGSFMLKFTTLVGSYFTLFSQAAQDLMNS